MRTNDSLYERLERRFDAAVSCRHRWYRVQVERKDRTFEESRTCSVCGLCGAECGRGRDGRIEEYEAALTLPEEREAR